MPEIRRLTPFLFLLLGLASIGGVALTYLLPSQILKPEANLSRELVKEGYESMLVEALRNIPAQKLAYIEREECWTEGKTVCVYGWYEERKPGAYLVSYTLADEDEARRGILEGWWWEVDYAKKIVRPVWLSAALREKYKLDSTDEFLKEASARPIVPPLKK